MRQTAIALGWQLCCAALGFKAIACDPFFYVRTWLSLSDEWYVPLILCLCLTEWHNLRFYLFRILLSNWIRKWYSLETIKVDHIPFRIDSTLGIKKALERYPIIRFNGNCLSRVTTLEPLVRIREVCETAFRVCETAFIHFNFLACALRGPCTRSILPRGLGSCIQVADSNRLTPAPLF